MKDIWNGRKFDELEEITKLSYKEVKKYPSLKVENDLNCTVEMEGLFLQYNLNSYGLMYFIILKGSEYPKKKEINQFKRINRFGNVFYIKKSIFNKFK